ncbi:hypothetical protein CHS0354_028146 [Potamilus streckersoni]|uniref:Uncharacterized protein n=1 Tax=Potamilus streckersoni TaxID=2493646 RepID=A0AAE0TJG9_9BIVA|nr:hypothetical protein CHS0354_028146 [Potamilus streckersoni]
MSYADSILDKMSYADDILNKLILHDTYAIIVFCGYQYSLKIQFILVVKPLYNGQLLIKNVEFISILTLCTMYRSFVHQPQLFVVPCVVYLLIPLKKGLLQSEVSQTLWIFMSRCPIYTRLPPLTKCFWDITNAFNDLADIEDYLKLIEIQEIYSQFKQQSETLQTCPLRKLKCKRRHRRAHK